MQLEHFWFALYFGDLPRSRETWLILNEVKSSPPKNKDTKTRLCVILRKWTRRNHYTSKKKRYKIIQEFLKNLVVEQNLTHPKDVFWS